MTDHLTELSRIFARGYLRLLKIQKSEASALAETAEKGITVTSRVNRIPISGDET